MEIKEGENSLVVQWLELQAFTAVGLDSIPHRETKILQAIPEAKKTQKKEKNGDNTLLVIMTGLVIK